MAAKGQMEELTIRSSWSILIVIGGGGVLLLLGEDTRFILGYKFTHNLLRVILRKYLKFAYRFLSPPFSLVEVAAMNSVPLLSI